MHDVRAPTLPRTIEPKATSTGWTWAAVAVAALLALALRIPFVGEPVYPDEGGYVLVARQWHGNGSMLYGDLFVDRPPLLMVFWRVAAALGGVQAARWLACLLVVALVMCAGWVGRLIGGHRGAVWSCFVAAALASTPVLGAHEVDGELLAVPLVMAGCAFALMALRATTPCRQAAWAATAGLVGVSAVLVKQNFVDALVFALVVVAVSWQRGRLRGRCALRLLGWGSAGGGLAVATAVAWASTTTPGATGLAYVMYGFRSDAGTVIFSHSLTAPLSRLIALSGAALVSGVLVIIALYIAWWAWSSRRRVEPINVAVLAMVVVGSLGVALGASYWPHYLVGLVPALALAVGSLGRATARPGRLATVAVVLVVISAVASTAASSATTYPSRLTETALESLLRSSSRAGDSAVITYGHANVIESAGLRPGYPYLWSLPMRILDPRLDLLDATLSGAAAPTWVVEWEGLDSWQIDDGGRLAATIDRGYRPVATVCDVTVLLRRDVDRPVAATPDPCAS